MSFKHKLKRTFTLVSSDGRMVRSPHYVAKWFCFAIMFCVLTGAAIYGIAESPLTYNCFENKCETVQYLE